MSLSITERMARSNGALTLDRNATHEAIAAVRDALDFMLDAMHGYSPDLASGGALALHRAATGLANLAGQVEDADPAPCGVLDLEAARQQREMRLRTAGALR